MSNSSAEPVKAGISSSDLREIDSWESAINLATNAFGGIVNAADVLGDGFQNVDKERLIDREFVILSYTFTKDKTSDAPFVVVRVVLRDGRKLFFTDGSTGVMSQCRDLESAGLTGGIYVARGLRVSRYTVTDDKGKDKEAATYYFDTSNAS